MPSSTGSPEPGVMRRRALSAALLLALLPLWPAPARAEPPTLSVHVTVDWEGWSLEEENLDAMRDFRKRFPHIPMLQLMNPVYFVRPGADARQIQAKIERTLLPSDTIGLHLHAWKTLVLHCGLPYRSAPSFAAVDETCEGKECGYTVSLELAYSTPELSRLVACGSRILVEQGYPRPRHFRAGGWQQGPKLAAALSEQGFSYDSSRIAADLLAPRWGADSAMVRLVQSLHPDAGPLDQPYPLAPGLTEYPNNGGLADYTPTPDILTLFRQVLAAKQPVLVLGFHQETAFDFLDRLSAAIPQMEQEARAAGVNLRWEDYR